MRTTLPSGREVEVLVTLTLPLPLDHFGHLLTAVGRCAEKLGYTDVGLVYDGPHAGCIAGTPPVQKAT